MHIQPATTNWNGYCVNVCAQIRVLQLFMASRRGTATKHLASDKPTLFDTACQSQQGNTDAGTVSARGMPTVRGQLSHLKYLSNVAIVLPHCYHMHL